MTTEELNTVADTLSTVTLQETYDMYLPDGEDKSIFDIGSASYIPDLKD